MEKCALTEVALDQLKQLFENCEIAIGHKSGWHITARGIFGVGALVLLAALAFIAAVLLR